MRPQSKRSRVPRLLWAAVELPGLQRKFLEVAVLSVALHHHQCPLGPPRTLAPTWLGSRHPRWQLVTAHTLPLNSPLERRLLMCLPCKNEDTCAHAHTHTHSHNTSSHRKTPTAYSLAQSSHPFLPVDHRSSSTFSGEESGPEKVSDLPLPPCCSFGLSPAPFLSVLYKAGHAAYMLTSPLGTGNFCPLRWGLSLNSRLACSSVYITDWP